MNQERVFKVLLGPHISEKATGLADGKSQFVFKVATDATPFPTASRVPSASARLLVECSRARKCPVIWVRSG